MGAVRQMKRAEPEAEIAPKALPHSEESERAVLAAVLLAPRVFSQVAGRLVEEDFYLERHQGIYKCMLEIQESGAEIDLRTLQARLEQRGIFERIGGMAYLAGLDLDLPDLGRVDTYVDMVKERSIRRQLILGCHRVAYAAHEGGTDAGKALAEVEALAFKLGHNVHRRGWVSLTETLDELIPALEFVEGSAIGIPTGFEAFDKETQGLIPSNLIILGARPGMGKTSFAVNVAQNVCTNGLAVGIFSLEMTRKELATRIMASEADVCFRQLRKGELTEHEWGKVYQAVKKFTGAPLYFDDSPNLTLHEMCAKARTLHANHGLSLLIVDYMQLASGSGRNENRQLEIAAISRGLKQLAKELNIPVLALSQLSRNPETRSGDHRPKLADLRESGAIEQDADMVVFVYRDELYNKDEADNKGLAELIIAKHRNGETGTVHLAFRGENTTFLSIANNQVERF